VKTAARIGNPKAGKRRSRSSIGVFARVGVLLLFLALHVASTAAQESHANGSLQKEVQIIADNHPTTFKVNVDLVLLRLVVYDMKGKAVGDLRREDFSLFDNDGCRPYLNSPSSVNTIRQHQRHRPGRQPC
jgi:hypothetical protein